MQELALSAAMFAIAGISLAVYQFISSRPAWLGPKLVAFDGLGFRPVFMLVCMLLIWPPTLELMSCKFWLHTKEVCQADSKAAILQTSASRVLMYASVAIMLAILEEIFFRGLVIGVLRLYIDPAKCIVLSAIIFAIAHAQLDPGVLFLLFAGGLALALVSQLNGVVASSVVHLALNIRTYASLKLPSDPGFGINPLTMEMSETSANLYVATLSLPMAIYIIWIFLKLRSR
jgi:membrane protease YdiL (CAAX protease family)